jgi:hypothetical protein
LAYSTTFGQRHDELFYTNVNSKQELQTEYNAINNNYFLEISLSAMDTLSVTLVKKTCTL